MDICQNHANFSRAPCDDDGGQQPRPVVKQCCCVRFGLASEASRPLLRHLRDKDDNEVSGIENRNTRQNAINYVIVRAKIYHHSRQLYFMDWQVTTLLMGAPLKLFVERGEL